MSITYENQRVVFDTILKKYNAYRALYKLVNNGSLQGVTGFDDFYWSTVYLTRYADPRSVGNNNF